MKKLVLSFLIILITAASVFLMTYNYGVVEIPNKVEEKVVEEDTKVIDSLELPPEENTETVIPESTEEEKETQGREKSPVKDKEIGVIKEEKKETSKRKEEELAPVFKMNKGQISSKISLTDKAKLLAIARKLSMIDYGNIVEISKSSDEMKSATEIFMILKQRLSEEDYNRIKGILEPYMYVENIEENITKNQEK